MTTATSPDVAPAGAHQHGVHPNLALVVIAAAQLMVVLDATIVNIALPHIQSALHFANVADLTWVLNAYTLVFGGLLLLGGRAGDLFGRRRMFIIGVLTFALASFAGGFAWDKGWLLAMRALQGVGGAIASPTALSLVTSTFDEGPARNRAFGVYAAVSGAGAAIGLILGGVLTSYLSWRWVLFVNAPIGLAIAAAAPFVLRESGRAEGRFGLADAVTSTLGMTSLVYGFIRAATKGWGNDVTLGAFGLAVVLLAAFVLMQSRSEQPLMPLRLFTNRNRVGAYVLMLVLGSAVFAMFYFLTIYVQKVLGYSPVKAGLAFLPVSATIVVVAQIVSRMVTHVEARYILASGTVFGGCGLYYLSTLTADSHYLTHVLPAIAMIAIGMGSIFVPITLAAVSDVEPRDTGIASAMLNVGQQIGGSLGVAALSTIATHVTTSYAMSHRVDPRGFARTVFPHPAAAAYTHGATAAFLTGSIFMVVGLVATLLLVKVRPQDPAHATPAAAA